VAVVEEVPVRVRGEPVVAIPVEDHRVVVRDPAASHQLPEILGTEEVALDLVLQLVSPIEPDRPRYVRLRIEGRVLVHLDDPYRVVVKVLGDPVGLDEDVLRIVRQGAPPKLFV
jgi:hypothetical protein